MELKKPEFHARLTQLIGNDRPYSWAERMGISKGAFNRIWKEGTIPGPDHLCNIAERAGVSIDWLLTGEGPERRDQVGASGLTEEEATLLEIYNDLSDDYKDELITSLKALIDLDQDSKKKRVDLLEKLRKGLTG